MGVIIGFLCCRNWFVCFVLMVIKTGFKSGTNVHNYFHMIVFRKGNQL